MGAKCKARACRAARPCPFDAFAIKADAAAGQNAANDHADAACQIIDVVDDDSESCQPPWRRMRPSWQRLQQPDAGNKLMTKPAAGL